MNTKEIIKKFIPPILLEAKAVLFPYKPANQPHDFSDLAQKNKHFKNIHSGETVYILASGPSIQRQDLKPLANKTTIAVSHFHLHKDIEIINPNYHVLAPQHPPFEFNDSSKYFKDFHNAYKKHNTKVFLGLTNYVYNYLELLKKFPELYYPHQYYIDYSRSPQLDETNLYDQSVWDLAKKPFGIRTVLYSAIQMAIYMGFKKIILLGCDHDYLNDIARTTNHHFYEEEKGISDKNHLDAFTKERWFLEYYMRWKQYRLINEFANSQGIKIYNATPGGMLDVFELKKYEETL